VQIREATRRDLTSVLALYSQPALDNGVVLSMEHAEHIFEQMLTYPNYRLYISVYGSLIIGTFTLSNLNIYRLNGDQDRLYSAE
ncbi:MAG: hypothetical protein AAFQ57_13835, partial [Cyanobacteria bacterium J06626_14]